MHYPDPSFYLSKILPCRPHHADSATRFSSRMSQRSNDMLSAFVYDIYESAAGIVGILELDHVGKLLVCGHAYSPLPGSLDLVYRQFATCAIKLE